MSAGYPTEAQLRRAIIERAAEYRRATGLALSTVSQRAVGRSDYIERVKRGGSFTIHTYSKLMDFFDSNMPAQERRRDGAKRKR